MIVGLSLIFAFLSYLIYRRLFSTGEARQSKTLPMWPFISTFITQPPNPKSPSSSQAQTTTTTATTPPSVVVTAAATASIIIRDYDALNFKAAQNEDTQQQQLQTRQIPAQASPPPPPPPSFSSPRAIPSFSPSPPDLPSPETTPKALAPSVPPTVETSAIPQISLLADDGRDGGDDVGARGVEGNSQRDSDDGVNGEHTEGDETDDDDIPPSFPSLNSAQRASGGISSLTSSSTSSSSLSPFANTDRTSSPVISTAKTTLSMAPPPIPFRGRNPKANARLISPSVPPQSSVAQQRQSASLAAQSRLAAVGLGASGVAAGNGLTLPNQRKSTSPSSNSRKKVILEPGHSTLDWARLQRSGVDLRGLPHPNLIKVSPSMLATHAKSPEDIWTALNGRVYNITAYLPFHPGGEKDLLRGAGKDCTKLFNATHPWVNVEGMLGQCLIGMYITEEEATTLAA
ncbi:hypothetical protein L873DRAFT_1638053, partial [Choiromyces venosus 120613-1]